MQIPLSYSICFAGNVLAVTVLAASYQEHKKRMFYHLVAALVFTDLTGNLNDPI